MAKLIGQHWPHLIFVALGVIVFLWTAYRPERSDRHRVPSRSLPDPPRAVPVPTSVRRSAARRGLLALGPLVGAVATGAILYGTDLGDSSIPGAVIWAHSGIALLALLLVLYKLADLQRRRIRQAFSRQRLPELISLALGATSVPLLVTGVGLLLAPSTRSFTAYTHLISSAWWTALLLWHLRRYLKPSLRVARQPRPAVLPTSSRLPGITDASPLLPPDPRHARP